MTALAVTQGSDKNAKGVIGHYTQVVWAETAEVGCGLIVTEEMKQWGKQRTNVRIVITRI